MTNGICKETTGQGQGSHSCFFPPRSVFFSPFGWLGLIMKNPVKSGFFLKIKFWQMVNLIVWLAFCNVNAHMRLPGEKSFKQNIFSRFHTLKPM